MIKVPKTTTTPSSAHDYHSGTTYDDDETCSNDNDGGGGGGDGGGGGGGGGERIGARTGRAVARFVPVQLTAFQATATTTTVAGATTTTAAGATTTTTVPGSTTTTTAPNSSSSSGSGPSAAEKVLFVATLTNLTRSRSQVQVDEQADLTYKADLIPATIPSATSNGNLLRKYVIGALLGPLSELLPRTP